MKGIVIDNGADSLKGGIAGEDNPKLTIAYTPSSPHPFFPSSSPNLISSHDPAYPTPTHLLSHLQHLKNPHAHGEVQNWDEMEAILQFTMETFKYQPKESAVTLTEAPNSAEKTREKFAEIFFEKFDVNNFYLMNSALSSSLAGGKLVSVVLEVSEDRSHVVPIYDGHVLSYAVNSFDQSGAVFTSYLAEMIAAKQLNLTVDHLRYIKANYCYVASNFSREIADRKHPTKIDLPDGNSIQLEDELFRCPELFFQPSLYNRDRDLPYLPDQIIQSIQRTQNDYGYCFLRDLFLVGGSTKFRGFSDRLISDLRSLVPPSLAIKSTLLPKHSRFLGASILSSLESFASMYSIDKRDYEEVGPRIVHYYCY